MFLKASKQHSKLKSISVLEQIVFSVVYKITG